MKTSRCRLRTVLVAALLLAGLVPGAAVAQEAQTAELAKQLSGLLDQLKLDSVAARDSAQQDFYYAALYFQGSQLLVVGAKYSVPVLLNEKLAKKDYKDVYIDLNSASVPETKIFIVDLGADGLKARREENQPYDTFEEGTTRLAFDGDWKKQKLTEDEYLKAFTNAEAKYAKILRALIAQVKKTS